MQCLGKKKHTRKEKTKQKQRKQEPNKHITYYIKLLKDIACFRLYIQYCIPTRLCLFQLTYVTL